MSSNPISRRCSRCVIPDSCSLIPIGPDGTCVLCKSLAEAVPKAGFHRPDESELLEHIETIRKLGKGKTYDCVVGVSGGRDSTFLIHLLTRIHGLRCLAVYYRTPFTPDIIDRNIRRIVKQTGADFEEIELSRDYHRKIARKMALKWRRKPHQILVNLACAPCKLLNREIYRIASRRRVPTVIYGTNVHEAVQIAPAVSKKQALAPGLDRVNSAGRKVKNMFRLAWSGAKVLRAYPSLLKYLALGVKSSVMYISPHTFFLSLRYPGIRPFNYFYGGRWDEADMEKTLKDLGWDRPPGCLTSWKADCSFGEIKNKMLLETIGMTYADGFFSNMVRAGVMNRDEALRRIETEGGISEPRLKEAEKILGLDEGFWI